MSNDAAGFASCYGPHRRSPIRASDAGLRPRPFPGETASLLPGLLAATRTGLTPAGDDELTNTKKHHGITSRCHLLLCWAHEKTSLVFPGVMGGPLRRGNFNQASAWPQAVASIGLTGLHFHDLRHTGNTLAGDAGASLRELMDRMGHSTTRAALIYQHRTSLRDKMIADEISRPAEAERPQSGTQRARNKDQDL